MTATIAAAAPVAAAPEVSKGTVSSIDEDEKSFTIATANDEQVTVEYDDKTTWILDGEVSTRDAVLKKDRQVTVTHAEGKATRVEAKSS